MSFVKDKLNNFFPVSHRKLYAGLVLGFLLKAVGAAWDASYHFKHFREFYQLPHIVNAFGDFIVIVLLAYLWLKEPKRDRPQLKIIFWGILIFIVGIGFDQWSHEKFGIDLTAWSPSHFMLYAGTFVALLGTFLYIFRDYHHGHISLQAKKIFGLIFSFLILENFWFPLLQHEQGVIMDYALKHGIRLADPDLLEIVFRTQHTVYSGLPDWLYGTWVVFCCVLMFQFIKRMNLHKYGATIVAGLYIVERLLMQNIFSLINYPLSTIPFFLIPVAFIFDILYNKLEKKSLTRDIVTSLVPLGVIIILALFNPENPIHPPIPILQTVLFAIPAAVLGYFFGTWLYLMFFKQDILDEK